MASFKTKPNYAAKAGRGLIVGAPRSAAMDNLHTDKFI